MNLARVGVLAPAESAADYPTFHAGEDAASLAAAWTAGWHPTLLAATGRLPELINSCQPPPVEDWSSGVVLCPTIGRQDAIEWLDALRTEKLTGCRVVEAGPSRAEVLSGIEAAADRPLHPPSGGLPTEGSGEFFALGYAYLQVAALTHMLHYGSAFDPPLFQATAVKAARAAVRGDGAAAEAALTRCYDLLHQARNHDYPADIFLLDVLLVAESTLGPSLAAELDRAFGATVLLTGALAERMADTDRPSVTALRRAIQEGRAVVANAGHSHEDLSLLPPAGLADSVLRGHRTLERVTGQPPAVFAQRHSSLPPRLPQVLAGLRYSGALLGGFDGRPPPASELGRTTWFGPDGTRLEAVAAVPHDLARPETILGLHGRLRETLGRDHAATVLLAGWPGTRNESLADLRGAARASGVLGRLTDLGDYFGQAEESPHDGQIPEDELGPAPDIFAQSGGAQQATQAGATLLAGLADLAAAAAVRPAAAADPLHGIASAIGARPGSAVERRLVVNPNTFPLATECSGGTLAPGLGFAVVSHPGGVPQEDSRRAATLRGANRPAPRRAEGCNLRNERYELTVDPHTGAIRSLVGHGTRRNRLSLRLAVAPSRSGRAGGRMVAEHVEVVEDTAGVGAIASSGRLLDSAGRTVARFTQRVSLVAQADTVGIDIRLDPDSTRRPTVVPLLQACVGEGPWRLFRGLQATRLPVCRARFVASEYAQAVSAGIATTLAFDRPREVHWRSVGVLQTPLNLANVPTPQRFAVSLSPGRPLHAALGLQSPPVALPVEPGPTTAVSGWWLHIDAAGVVAASLGPAGAPGRLRMTLLETLGKATTCRLRAFRPLRSAFVSDPAEAGRESAPIADGVATLELRPHGWIDVDAAW